MKIQTKKRKIIIPLIPFLMALGSILSFPGFSQADTGVITRKVSTALTISKVPTSVNLGNSSLGAHHKISAGKGAEFNQQAIAGVPTREGRGAFPP